MRRQRRWFLAGLMLVGLFGVACVSDAQVGTWTRKADMPTGRYWVASAVVSGKIYTFGGYITVFGRILTNSATKVGEGIN